MAWFKVDDKFHSSKPVVRIPRRYRAQAVGLWILAGTWSAQEESDGFIPDFALEDLCGTPAIAAHLVRAGLWIEVTGESQEGSSIPKRGSSIPDSSGWKFKNWEKYQPTREQLEEIREKERKRKADYRMSQRDTKGTPPGHPKGHHPESEHPDPTRPDPLTEAKASVPRKRAQRIPDGFEVPPEMVAWGREKVPHVDGRLETEKFINYWTAKSGKDATKLDWVATWRNWMLNASQNTGRSTPTRQTPSDRAAANMALVTDNPLDGLLQLGEMP